LRASRRTATSEIEPAAILRDGRAKSAVGVALGLISVTALPMERARCGRFPCLWHLAHFLVAQPNNWADAKFDGDFEFLELRKESAPSLNPRHQLAYLDQVAVGVAHVAADLVATVERRGEKLRSAGAPLLIDGADVGDTDVEKAGGAIGI